MTKLEFADRERRNAPQARIDAFKALTEERDALRAAATSQNAPKVPAERTPKPDVAAVEQRISALTSETTPKENPVTSDNLIRKIGGDTEQTERAQRIGATWYVGPNQSDVYMRGGGNGRTYFGDLIRGKALGDANALERLRTNSRARADEEKRAGLTTTNGGGGEFVPPLWLEEDFVRYARPGRATANIIPTLPLPAGTDSINIPKVLTGTGEAIQSAQNTGITEVDLTTTSVASSVATIAGGQTVSLQLVEQSPIGIDLLVLQDLAAAYAVALDSQVLSGSGVSGQLMGLNTLSGTNAITFSGTALTGSNSLHAALLKAIETVHVNRFAPPDAIVMHPRRWSWLCAQVDTLNRPIIVPDDGAPQNALGTYKVDAPFIGAVGTLCGLPVYLDALIPVNLGAGTNQDNILVMRTSDLVLWESDIRADAFQQTYAQNMSVYCRLYNYVSFQPGRYPASISIVNGTGLDQVL